MRSILRFSSVVICLLAITNPLGAQWVQTSGPSGSITTVSALFAEGPNIYAGTDRGLFVSTDNGESWNAGNLTNLEFDAFATIDTEILAGTNNGVYLSADGGSNWTSIALMGNDVHSFCMNGNDVFAGTNAGVFYSADSGRDWTAVSNGLASKNVTCVAASKANLFVATMQDGQGNWGGVYRSTDNGKSWVVSNSGLPSNCDVRTLQVCPTTNGTNVYAGVSGTTTIGQGIFLSTDDGVTWLADNNGPAGFSPIVSRFLAIQNASNTFGLFAGATEGVFLSTDNGAHWQSTSFPSPGDITALAANGLYLFAGQYSENLFGGDSLVWRRPLSQMITAVKEETVPMNYCLSQNYPNPFNPTTVISYQLAASNSVTLKVYDILGREVATLVNTIQSEGEHIAKFDGSRFASGVYLYRLEAVRSDGGRFIEAKRMVLIK